MTGTAAEPRPGFLDGPLRLYIGGEFIDTENRLTVLDPATGELKRDPDDDTPEQPELADAVCKHIASKPEGMSALEIQAAFPQVSKPRLYRAFDELLQTKRILRTGKPRTPEVRYKAV